MTWKPDVMVYHADCADGFGAAWAAWMRWGNDVNYVPRGYGDAPPNVTGLNVLIGDFSFKRDVLTAMAQTAKSIVVLDHHKTAQEELAPFAALMPEAVAVTPEEVPALLRALADLDRSPIIALFDMAKSGARLTWEFCHPGAAVPWLILYIEDRDLWEFNYVESKPFALWLRAEPLDFHRWKEISRSLNSPVPIDSDRIMGEAKAMQRFYDAKVKELVAMARPVYVGGQFVPGANCPASFSSEVGNALLVAQPDAPFSVCYSDGQKVRSYSLRSADGRADVSLIAKAYGGGGHRNAAGFAVPLS